MRPKRKLKRKLPFVIFIACMLLLVGAMVVAGQLWVKLTNFDLNSGTDDPGPTMGSTNILLLGTDARSGEKTARTDTIILAHVDTDNNRLCLLSIPRDTKVSIPRHGVDKINAANIYGGPNLTAQVVSGLVGVPVKYYALTNWEGFKDIVDTLGGVDINVERRMYHPDPEYPSCVINLQPGPQRMDGKKALQYVRYRGDALGDISRTERQLKFLQAVAAEMNQAGTILKLHRLVPEINDCLDTNLSLKQMFTFAKMGKNFNQVQIVTQTLPGYFLDQGGVSYWGVDPAEAKKVAQSLFTTGQVANVMDSPANGGSGYTLAYKPLEEKTDNNPAVPTRSNSASANNTTEDNRNETGSSAGSSKSNSGGKTVVQPEVKKTGTDQGGNLNVIPVMPSSEEPDLENNHATKTPKNNFSDQGVTKTETNTRGMAEVNIELQE